MIVIDCPCAAVNPLFFGPDTNGIVQVFNAGDGRIREAVLVGKSGIGRSGIGDDQLVAGYLIGAEVIVDTLSFQDAIDEREVRLPILRAIIPRYIAFVV